MRYRAAICNGRDGVRGLTSALSSVLPDSRRLMCWAHAKRNIRNRKGPLREFWQVFESDIDYLQRAPTLRHFEIAAGLLIQKTKDQHFIDFAHYFRMAWVESENRLWFEGATMFHPSTNNGLESFNRQSKAEHTFHKRARLGEFLHVLEDMVRQKSAELQDFVLLQTYLLNHETKAYQWANDGPTVISDA